ncbi:cobalamin biosynthesis protein [Nostoc sp. UHCC 0870]|uniref:cobalamin biosynthesis protein n=1 Tax=Nostoc sp. UHCC 0870 TaxID=2914041 RepID=UPI001EE0B7DF|nr:cobalamin biosynthesis protein [Nostoc sp. UHCC 0870]UKO96694.1 cobalamin biosynthesis protein [Nostoc sp. UHCC 0870]
MQIIPEQQPVQQNLWIGFGCQSGISSELLLVAIEQVFQNYNLPQTAIAGLATIDIKASEPGLIEFCRSYDLPLKTFPAESLSSVVVPHPTVAIAKIVGTPSVAEASAILAASQLNFAVKLLVPKQIFRLPAQPGAVTIAVAQPRFK